MSGFRLFGVNIGSKIKNKPDTSTLINNENTGNEAYANKDDNKNTSSAQYATPDIGGGSNMDIEMNGAASNGWDYATYSAEDGASHSGASELTTLKTELEASRKENSELKRQRRGASKRSKQFRKVLTKQATTIDKCLDAYSTLKNHMETIKGALEKELSTKLESTGKPSDLDQDQSYFANKCQVTLLNKMLKYLDESLKGVERPVPFEADTSVTEEDEEDITEANDSPTIVNVKKRLQEQEGVSFPDKKAKLFSETYETTKPVAHPFPYMYYNATPAAYPYTTPTTSSMLTMSTMPTMPTMPTPTTPTTPTSSTSTSVTSSSTTSPSSISTSSMQTPLSDAEIINELRQSSLWISNPQSIGVPLESDSLKALVSSIAEPMEVIININKYFAFIYFANSEDSHKALAYLKQYFPTLIVKMNTSNNVIFTRTLYIENLSALPTALSIQQAIYMSGYTPSGTIYVKENYALVSFETKDFAFKARRFLLHNFIGLVVRFKSIVTPAENQTLATFVHSTNGVPTRTLSITGFYGYSQHLEQALEKSAPYKIQHKDYTLAVVQFEDIQSAVRARVNINMFKTDFIKDLADSEIKPPTLVTQQT